MSPAASYQPLRVQEPGDSIPTTPQRQHPTLLEAIRQLRLLQACCHPPGALSWSVDRAVCAVSVCSPDPHAGAPVASPSGHRHALPPGAAGPGLLAAQRRRSGHIYAGGAASLRRVGAECAAPPGRRYAMPNSFSLCRSWGGVGPKSYLYETKVQWWTPRHSDRVATGTGNRDSDACDRALWRTPMLPQAPACQAQKRAAASNR